MDREKLKKILAYFENKGYSRPLCWKCEQEIKYADDVSIDPLTKRVYCPTCIEFIKELVCPVCHQRSFIWAFKVINGQRICLTCVNKRNW